MIVIYFKLYFKLFISLIYIENIFHSLLRPKTKFSFFAWVEDRMMSVGSNFLWTSMLGWPSPSLSTCVHLSLVPFPPCGRHKWMILNTMHCKKKKSVSEEVKVHVSKLKFFIWLNIICDWFFRNQSDIAIYERPKIRVWSGKIHSWSLLTFLH